MLNGKRGLSIEMILNLHEGLGIPLASLIARPKASRASKSVGVKAPTSDLATDTPFDNTPYSIQSPPPDARASPLI